MKEKLINFLVDNGCYDEFISELESDNEFSGIDDLCENGEDYFLIQDAFVWNNSPSGQQFWSDIDNEWRELCENSETDTI